MVFNSRNLVILLCFCNRVWAQQKQYISDTGTANTKYKAGILFIAPVQFTENGPGAGITYERLLNNKRNISVNISGIATFNIANTSKIYNYNTGYYNTGNPDAMFYLLPGIQFYPFVGRRRVSYSLGPSLDIANGKKSSDYYNYNGLNTAELVQSHFVTGLLLQNYIHYNYSAHTCIGFEMGLGGSIINKVGGNAVANEFLIQGALKIGYRL